VGGNRGVTTQTIKWFDCPTGKLQAGWLCGKANHLNEGQLGCVKAFAPWVKSPQQSAITSAFGLPTWGKTLALPSQTSKHRATIEIMDIH